jgi:1-acyl-sn-glycerol-3-phosphate acyltransferase
LLAAGSVADMRTYQVIKDIVYLTVRGFFIGVAKILFRFESHGSEYIPATGSAIIASNHTSYLDPPFIGMGATRPIFYFAKAELFSSFFGAALRFVNAVPVNRDQLDRKTLKTILDILDRGDVIVMFPEGTRSTTNELQPAKPGIGMIAYHARVPVIPAYISGSHEVLPKNAKVVRLKKCTVRFGPPVNLQEFFQMQKTKDLYLRMSQEIMAAIQKLRD